jgi:hypothetical protein
VAYALKPLAENATREQILQWKKNKRNRRSRRLHAIKAVFQKLLPHFKDDILDYHERVIDLFSEVIDEIRLPEVPIVREAQVDFSPRPYLLSSLLCSSSFPISLRTQRI